MENHFIYFVHFDDFLVCHNLGCTRRVCSPTVAHIESFKEDHPIYTTNIDKLSTDPNALQTFGSPRLANVRKSLLIKQGYKLGVGIENTRFYSDKEINTINTIAEIEIEFEKIRRVIDRRLPSRLVCIYLADDNFEGRVMLQNMFYSRKHFIIVPVRIIFLLRVHRADSRWIAEFEKNHDKKAIENYWKGIPLDNNPQYEYLIDGTIELENLADKENIFKEYSITHCPKH